MQAESIATLPNLTRLTISQAEVPLECQMRLAQLSKSLIALNLGADGLHDSCNHTLTAAALGRLTHLTKIWLGRMTFENGTRFQMKENLISHVWPCGFAPDHSGMSCVHPCRMHGEGSAVPLEEHLFGAALMARRWYAGVLSAILRLPRLQELGFDPYVLNPPSVRCL